MKTILVVEDFSYARHFICSALKSKGYNTLNAATAQEAYDALAKDHSVNLVLSDFNIPDSDGFDLLKTIKNDPELENIPVMFFTSEYHTDKIRYAQESGLASFIQKPFREDHFFAEIDRAINIKGSLINMA